MKTKKEKENYAFLVRNLTRLGIAESDIDALVRIERTLSRWHERECNELEYNENGVPHVVFFDSQGKRLSYRVPNRWTGAEKRLEKLLQKYPNLEAYIQQDPRGCALYVYKKGTVPMPVESHYSGHAVAVCY